MNTNTKIKIGPQIVHCYDITNQSNVLYDKMLVLIKQGELVLYPLTGISYSWVILEQTVNINITVINITVNINISKNFPDNPSSKSDRCFLKTNNERYP